MNKLFTTLFALSSTISIAQISIPNNSFEDWDVSIYQDTNCVGWKSPGSTVMKVLGENSSVKPVYGGYSSNSALLIRNVYSSSFDTLFGGLVFADISIKGKLLPTYLKGHIKHNLVSGEKAIISYGYKTTDLEGYVTIYALGFKTFTGTNSTYIPFKINTNSDFYPKRLSDTLQILVSSYNYFSKNAVAVSESSNLTIDSLGFFGQVQNPVISAGNTIANGDFSSWYDLENIKAPSNWYVTGLMQDITPGQVSQSNDAQSGATALQLGVDPTGTPVGVYTYFKPTSGTKFVNGYTKFDLGVGDTVLAYISKYSKTEGLDGPILDSMIFTGGQVSYKSFSLKFDGKIQAGDTLALQFFAYNSSQFENLRIEANSKILIDNVTLGATPLAIENEDVLNITLAVSPNPSSSGLFNIHSNQKMENLKVYNSTGIEMKIETIYSEKSALINLSQNQHGIYYLVQEGKNNKRVKLVY